MSSAPAATSPPRLELRVEASAAGVAQGVQACEHFLAQHDITPKARLRMALVLEEVLMNLTLHGHPASGEHHAEVTLILAPDALELSARDDGAAFDPQSAPLPPRPGTLEEARPGGLGLALMRRYSRDMRYQRVDGHNCLTLWLARD